MASFGLLGAIGGAAQGVATGVQSQLEEARQMRLEEVRTRNNRETNSQNNTQRHELSLAQMKAQGDQAKDLATFNQELKPAPRYEDSTLGGVQGQREVNSNKFDALPTSAGGLPNDAKMHQYWQSQGYAPEVAASMVVKEGETEDKYRRRIISDMAGASFDGSVDEDAVANAVRIAFPPKPPAFNNADEALAAAKKRYPQADEATLLEALKAKYPNVFRE